MLVAAAMVVCVVVRMIVCMIVCVFMVMSVAAGMLMRVFMRMVVGFTACLFVNVLVGMIVRVFVAGTAGMLMDMFVRGFLCLAPCKDLAPYLAYVSKWMALPAGAQRHGGFTHIFLQKGPVGRGYHPPFFIDTDRVVSIATIESSEFEHFFEKIFHLAANVVQ